MNPLKSQLAQTLNHLGIAFDLSTFSKRLILQKKVYLAQVTGIDLGYRFGWYLRGPYSKSLTAEAFELVEDFQQDETSVETAPIGKDKRAQLNKVKPLCEIPSGEDFEEGVWLELLASLHFLRHVAYRPAGSTRDFEDTFDTMCESKPQFAKLKGHAELAWGPLNEFGLIESRYFSA